MPIIQQKLNDLNLGQITFSGGEVDNLDLKFNFNNMDAIKASFSGANNAVQVHA